MKKTKIFMNVLVIVLILIVVLSVGTYAYYFWNTDSTNETKIVSDIGAATVYFDGGASLAGVGIRPVPVKEEGIVKTIKIKTNTSTVNNISFNLYLDISSLDENLKNEDFKFAFYEGETLVKEGNFSTEYLTNNEVECTTNSTKHIVLVEGKNLTTTLSTYTLYIWIDGTVDNDASMQNGNFTFNLHATGQNAIVIEGKIPDITTTVEGSLAYNIVQKYLKSNLSDVSNNGIIYHYDAESQLMSDTGGNLRYYGKTPNNYIYFNCDTYPDTNCEKWRIIGVFDGKVKIIRDAAIGYYSWDTSPSTVNSGNGINEWSQADLMKLLNPGYEANKDLNNTGEEITVNNSLYWNKGSGTCYNGSKNATTTCDFTSKGLKNDTTKNKIADSLWYLGGHNSDSVYPNQIYEYERGTNVMKNPSDKTTRTTTWEGKIGLMYPSDYGYAADLSQCNQNLYGYSNATCKNTNWLFNGGNPWLLTPSSSYADGAGSFYSQGTIFGLNSDVGFGYMVRPVLYLNSNIVMASGDGSSSNPYTLKA